MRKPEVILAPSLSGSRLTCQLAGIPAGGQLDFTIVLQARSVGTHVNTLSLFGQQYDPDLLNNTVLHTLVVN